MCANLSVLPDNHGLAAAADPATGLRYPTTGRRSFVTTGTLAAATVLFLAACRDRPAVERGTPDPWFEETARPNGLDFVHQSGHHDRFLLPEIMGGGAALFDMDDDGDLDVYLVQSGSVLAPSARPSGNRLFRNRGNGAFEDVT